MEISTDFIIATSAIWILLLLGILITWLKHKYRHSDKQS
jgi:hypothetical protein